MMKYTHSFQVLQNGDAGETTEKEDNTRHKKLFLMHPQPFELQNEFPDRTGPMACLPVSVHGSVQLTEFPDRTGPMACLQ